MLAPVEVTPRLSKAFRYSKATDLRCSSVIVCFATAISFFEGNAALVLRQPLVERLELRIQLPCDIRAPRCNDFFFELAINLEHVAHLIRALEPEAPVRVRVDRIIFHGTDAEAFRKLLTHLVDRQILAGNAH